MTAATQHKDHHCHGLRHLVGNTPLMGISYKFRGRQRVIYAKAEHFNMTGSIKDRMALYILNRAYREGRIKPGDTIAEAVADAIFKDPAQRPSLESLAKEIRAEGKSRKVTLSEFRMLTGACLTGCKSALERAGRDTKPMTAFEIRDIVSREWGEKLIRVIGWEDKYAS